MSGSRDREEQTGALLLRVAGRWHVIAVAALAGAAIVAGAFDPGFGAGWFTALVALLLLGAAARDLLARARPAGEGLPRALAEVEGPLLWTVAAWMLTRLGGDYQAHLGLIPAALVAWLVATRPLSGYVFPVIAGLALEVGLTAAGRQDGAALILHLILYTGAAFGLAQFARGEAWRRRLHEAREKAAADRESRDRARDFGLLTEQAPAVRTLPGLGANSATMRFNRITLDYLDEALGLQVELIRAALELTTAAVLLGTPDRKLRLRVHSTGREVLERGPFEPGQGMVGGLRGEVREVAVAPIKSGFGGLPYYRDHAGVGGAFAIVVSVDEPSGRVETGPEAVLCVDRASDAPWTERERRVLRLAAQRMGLTIAAGRQLKANERERDDMHSFCAGLGELNQVLGLEPVIQAALQSVRALVPFDLAAISLLDEAGLHTVVRAEGVAAQRLGGLQFAADEGLVGQAVKINHALPAGGVYRGGQAIFTAADRFPELRSLLILPLRKDEGGTEPIGALTVAARAPGAFVHNQQLLELIAAQVAIKIDLAQAHEQIRELATTDGLTGLANHRSFQQTFDNMLNRARRQGGRMCMLLADIDKFKVLNDTYGHPFGDEVLRHVSAVLREAVRKVDLAARYGGEEFALLLEDSDAGGGMLLAERIRADVEALEVRHETGPVTVTLSIGVAAYPRDGSMKAELIERADQALYRAKETGRNRVVAWADPTIGAADA